MTSNVLVFGNIGTELVIDSRHYEIVTLGEQGQTSWRTRCEVCRTVMFVQTMGGKLPGIGRCIAHRRKTHPTQAVSEAERQAMIARAQANHPNGIAPIRDFLPLPTPGTVSRATFENDEQDQSIMGDEATFVDGAPASNGFDVASLSAELEGLSPEDAEEAAPRPTSDAMWEQRVQMFVEQRMWMLDEWGPRPDQKGCLVPEEILDRFRR